MTRPRPNTAKASPPPQARQGNLDAVLTSYDQPPPGLDGDDPTQTTQHISFPQSIVSGLPPINIPGKFTNNNWGGIVTDSTNQYENNKNNNDFDRGRSLTLGSEFDLDWESGRDERGLSFSGLLTPLGDPIPEEIASTTTVVSTYTSASTEHHSTNNNNHHLSAPSASADGIVNSTASSQSNLNFTLNQGGHNSTWGQHQANVQQQRQQQMVHHQTLPARSRGDSTASASQFLNELYNRQQYPLHQQPRNQGQFSLMSHTPPTQMGSSYENSHFGKRMRAGSISGRLRSASDLEDTGIISREQKAILKDLIIAGDNSVQSAIDKYEAGDASALEDMIKSGALLVRPTDMDLLSDLDLDFLNVHDDEVEGQYDHDGMFGSIDDIGGGNESSHVGISGHGRQYHGGGTLGSSMNDGIGDLEFNGDFMPSSGTMGNNNLPSAHAAMMHRKARGNSVDDIDIHRMRANSLALPGLLLDGAYPDDSHLSIGRWMDKDLMGNSVQHAVQLKGGTTAVKHRRHSQFSSECDVLMASKLTRQGEKPKATKEKTKKLSPTRKEKKEPSPNRKEKKELSTTKKERKELSTNRKEKKEPREKKSQSKMKDMMEGISTTIAACSTEVGDEEESKEVQSGLGRPRSMSDPNLSVRLDDYGLLRVNGPEGWVGAYSPDSRHLRVSRFLEKRNQRVWVKKVKYDVRKNFADSRLRVKGRFVRKEDEMLMRELMSLT